MSLAIFNDIGPHEIDIRYPLEARQELCELIRQAVVRQNESPAGGASEEQR